MPQDVGDVALAEEIVDGLKAVEVEEVQCEQLIAAPGAGDQVAQPFLQQAAVRQVG